MIKVILDANVPAKAAVSPAFCPESDLQIQEKCMSYIENLVNEKDSKLVLDIGYEIMTEYRNNVCKDSNMGKIFFRWLYDYYSRIDNNDHIKLEKNDNGQYKDYPYYDDTKDFDESDKKYIALANAHSEKPPIIEATDGKWMGYESVFLRYDISIEFLDRNYAQRVYEKKIINKKRKK